MSSEDPGSNSGLLIVLKGSDDRAEEDDAERAFREPYFDRLVRLAKVRLRHAPCAMLDQVDAALSAIIRVTWLRLLSEEPTAEAPP
jgi:hypothetical protein